MSHAPVRDWQSGLEHRWEEALQRALHGGVPLDVLFVPLLVMRRRCRPDLRVGHAHEVVCATLQHALALRKNKEACKPSQCTSTSHHPLSTRLPRVSTRQTLVQPLSVNITQLRRCQYMSHQEQGSLTGVLKCVGEAGGMPGCEAAAADVPDTVRPNCCEGLVPLPSGWADAVLGAAAGLDCGWAWSSCVSSSAAEPSCKAQLS